MKIPTLQDEQTKPSTLLNHSIGQGPILKSLNLRDGGVTSVVGTIVTQGAPVAPNYKSPHLQEGNFRNFKPFHFFVDKKILI